MCSQALHSGKLEVSSAEGEAFLWRIPTSSKSQLRFCLRRTSVSHLVEYGNVLSPCLVGAHVARSNKFKECARGARILLDLTAFLSKPSLYHNLNHVTHTKFPN